MFSYSFVNSYNICPLMWYLKYRLKYKIDKIPNATDPLLIGTLLHDSIEHGIKQAEYKYYMNFPIIDDCHVHEVLKVQHLLNKFKVPEGLHEVKLETDNFIGYIDLVEHNHDGTVNIYDFKYSNYREETEQLHLYKYYYEKINNVKVNSIFYVYFPKLKLKKEFNESEFDFRKRLKSEVDKVTVDVVELTYDKCKVQSYFDKLNDILKGDKVKAKHSNFCWICDYNKICSNIKDVL